jgi:hypothetical protein
MLFPGDAVAAPFETQVFQFLNTRGRDTRCLSFDVKLVLLPLGSDPTSQLGIFAATPRNIAMPVDFAIVRKLVETGFPGRDPPSQQPTRRV